MPNRPSKHTATLLWGACGNECCNPDCSEQVLLLDKAHKEIKKLGEIAHIKGAKPGSNRYDSSQTDEERHHYDNLLILCRKCHKEQPHGVDIPANESKYPAALLKEWKYSHLEKIQKLNDRNWICNPNGAHIFQDGDSIAVKYWINEKGMPQLFTAEQLTIVEQLFKLNLSFSQLHSMLNMIENTKGKPIDPGHQTLNDSTVGQLYNDSQHLPKLDEYGWIGYLVESLQIAQDVTLGELHAMMVQDGLAKKEELRRMGLEKLREKAANVDPQPIITKVDDNA